MAQIQEPPSAYNAKHPYNKTRTTPGGHVQMFDDTPGAEIIRTQHRAGTFTEWQPDGTEVHKIIGNGYRIVAQDDNVIIQGKCNINIVGNAEVTIQGDAITNIQGNEVRVVEKDSKLVVKGTYTVSSGGDLNLNSVGQTSGVYLQAGDRLVLNTDLTVHGEVLADSIHSDGSVTAGTGIHAGVMGSANPVAGISTLGGINVGIPGPTVPGVVDATVFVTAPAIIGTVVTFGTVLMDPEGGAPSIRNIYDLHTHLYNPGPGGLTETSDPFPYMP
jgi:hypothetical protein